MGERKWRFVLSKDLFHYICNKSRREQGRKAFGFGPGTKLSTWDKQIGGKELSEKELATDFVMSFTVTSWETLVNWTELKTNRACGVKGKADDWGISQKKMVGWSVCLSFSPTLLLCVEILDMTNLGRAQQVSRVHELPHRWLWLPWASFVNSSIKWSSDALVVIQQTPRYPSTRQHVGTDAARNCIPVCFTCQVWCVVIHTARNYIYTQDFSQSWLQNFQVFYCK